MNIYSDYLDRYREIAVMAVSGQLTQIPKYISDHFPGNDAIDRDYLERQLIEAGVTVLGMGAFSICFTLPGIDHAIKLTHNKRDRWSIYAKYAMENHESNPMLPKVYGIFEHDGWCVSRMELLQDAYIDLSVGMQDVVKAVRSPVFSVMNLTRKRKIERIEFYLKKWFALNWFGNYSRKHLADIVVWLAGTGSKVTIDCHGKNWMQRKSQLVLTDPIY